MKKDSTYEDQLSINSAHASVTRRCYSGLILGLHLANERRRYKVTSYLTGREQT